MTEKVQNTKIKLKGRLHGVNQNGHIVNEKNDWLKEPRLKETNKKTKEDFFLNF